MNLEGMTRTPSGSNLYSALIVSALCLLNFGCGQEGASIDSITDPAAKILALENENTKLRSENQSRSEQLAVYNAQIPGGLALGEREKQMDEREARLAQSEKALVRRDSELNETERRIKEELKRLGLARQKFVAGKEELLIQIGESKQMTERYKEVQQDKNDALSGERMANLRVGEFVSYIAVAVSVAFLSVLLAITYSLRHRMECRNIEMAMEALRYANLPFETRAELAARLGRALPNYPKDRME